MRTRLGITAFVWLTLSLTGLAQKVPHRYTTLVIEYTGETITVSLPIIVTTSQEEGEWYRQHFLRHNVTFEGSYIQLVPESVLDEITRLPSLRPALERARTIEEHLSGSNESKTAQNATFSAGEGHYYASVIVDKQPSMNILKGIDRIAAKYPSLKAGLHQLEYHLK